MNEIENYSNIIFEYLTMNTGTKVADIRSVNGPSLFGNFRPILDDDKSSYDFALSFGDKIVLLYTEKTKEDLHLFWKYAVSHMKLDLVTKHIGDNPLTLEQLHKEFIFSIFKNKKIDSLFPVWLSFIIPFKLSSETQIKADFFYDPFVSHPESDRVKTDFDFSSLFLTNEFWKEDE